MVNRYLFIHIPKTAGVKIRHNIHMNVGFPHAKVLVQEEGVDLRFVTDAELQESDIISGHFGYALRRRLEPTRLCVTVLRRPLDRIISGYYYWKTLHGTALEKMANALSIYDFVASQDTTVVEYVDNSQTWQIFADFLAPTRGQHAACTSADILAGAKANLAAFDCVGIQEDIPGTLAKMKRVFSWKWTDEAGKWMNKTPEYDVSKIDISLLRERLGDRIAMDEELYALALELFARQ
jgi:hypothetical protein